MNEQELEALRQQYLLEWIASRPPAVQALIAEFPLGTVLRHPDGYDLYLVGYGDGSYLIVSEVDPVEDYDAATAKRGVIEVECARQLPKQLRDV